MELRNFYKFISIKNLETIRKTIFRKGEDLQIKGTVLLAEEGINAAISAHSSEQLAQMQSCIENLLQTTFAPLITNLSEKDPTNPNLPFSKFKVRVRDEIVKLGVKGLDPECTTGILVSPQEWNDLITDPETITIDTRNIYEYLLGHFRGAINPNTPNFTDFADYVHNSCSMLQKYKRIAMYCTGGIRCEKATTFMITHNISQVYQLHGGILAYFRDIPQEAQLWKGACFVFDDRIAVNKDMTPCTLQKTALPEALHKEKERSRHDGFIYSKIMSISY